MKKKTKIILLAIMSVLVLIAGGIAVYMTQYYEGIEQKVKEVTLSYTKEAPRSSSYYFTGQRSELEFDKNLFQFQEIKDYKVTLTFRDKAYLVNFHIIDDVKPTISFLMKEIDLYQGFNIKDLYTVHDEKSKVSVTLNMKEEDFVEGEHNFCVTATDESKNSEKKCQLIKVVDTTPKVDVTTALKFDYDYANMTLDAIFKDYTEKRGLSNQVAFSYHNLVTNETFFRNPDQWMTAGSTYKLPLNMYYYEQENAGKISQSTVLSFKDYDFEEGGPVAENYKPGDKMSIADLQFYSIAWSDNTASRKLFDHLGGWEQYRELVKKYSSSTTYTSDYYANNFCVRYMNDVLIYLYQHIDSFPELSGRLFGVAPGECLKQYVDVPIMQKDGFYGAAYNAAGIVYADKPYAVAVYTSLGDQGPKIIGEINLILYQYAQAH